MAETMSDRSLRSVPTPFSDSSIQPPQSISLSSGEGRFGTEDIPGEVRKESSNRSRVKGRNRDRRKGYRRAIELLKNDDYHFAAIDDSFLKHKEDKERSIDHEIVVSQHPSLAAEMVNSMLDSQPILLEGTIDVPSQHEFDISSEDTFILSSLDDKTHSEAFDISQEEIYHGSVFPSAFPWNRPKVLLPASSPRDIDELAAILKSEYDETFGPNSSANNEVILQRTLSDCINFPELCETNCNNEWKYTSRSFSNNGPKGNKGMGFVPRLSTNKILYPSSIQHMARHLFAIGRGSDPGVVTLITVMMPSENYFKEPRHWKEFFRETNILPWSWNPSQKVSFTKFICSVRKDNLLSHRRVGRDERIKFAKQCSRKWNISVKVAGVTSRSKLFPECQRTNNKTDGKSFCQSSSPSLSSNSSKDIYFKGCIDNYFSIMKKRKLIDIGDEFKSKRIRLANASMPATIQNGCSVTLDVALLSELENIQNPLGSYDCRQTNLLEMFYDDLLGSKVNTDDICIASMLTSDANKSKRVYVGRTRIIWSAPLSDGYGRAQIPNSGPGVRIPYFSLLTNTKLESNFYKRPREVRVAVKVNDDFLYDLSSEKIDNQLIENVIGESVRSPTSRHLTCVEQDRSTCWYARELRSCAKTESILGCRGDFKKYSKSRVQNNIFNAVCTVNRHKLMNSILKIPRTSKVNCGGKSTFCHDSWTASTFRRKKKLNEGEEKAIMKLGASNSFQFFPPRLECFPQNDGSIHVFCAVPGTLKPTNVGPILRKLCEGGGSRGSRRCSVCWLPESDEMTADIKECITCGVLVHETCSINGNTCKRKKVDTNSWQCPVCFYNDSTSKSSQVPIAYHKPRRSQKIPSKFRNTDCNLLSPSNDSSNLKDNSLPIEAKQCEICPHKGGSMSMLSTLPNSCPRWVHNVCQIWSGIFEDKIVKKSNQTHCLDVCCLCGQANKQQLKDGLNKLSTKPYSYRLAKCAARGCFVHFHPMCAHLVNTLSHSNKSGVSPNNPDQGTSDEQLCDEYTLDILKVSAPTDHGKESFGDKEHVPVMFCGLHNPKRDNMYYGLPSGGGHVISCLRIPSVDKAVSNTEYDRVNHYEVQCKNV